MTNSQKQQIVTLRGEKATYADIAAVLGLSVNTIKSYCQRNGLGVASDKPHKPNRICEQCKHPIEKPLRGNQRFCSDACRLDWWHCHPKKLNQKAVYHFKCPACHKAFTAYGNANRTYCSRKCYGKSKAVAK